MNSEPSNALNWIDKNLEEALSAPDEAFDWVFMLHESDWPLLEEMYDTKPTEWRLACAYVFVDGPIRESRTVLTKALFDTEKQVREQAAETMCHQLREYPEEAGLDPATIKRIRSTLLDADCADEADLELLNQKVS